MKGDAISIYKIITGFIATIIFKGDFSKNTMAHFVRPFFFPLHISP